MKIYDEAIDHIANQRIEIDLDDGVKLIMRSSKAWKSLRKVRKR